MILEKETEKKTCFLFNEDIEKITEKFLKKGFLQEKNPSRGAIRCFIYSLGLEKRLHVRIFEKGGKYACYGHTEPKPITDPLFHLKGAIAGNVKTQKALNVAIGITKIAADILDVLKPKKEEKIESEEDKEIIEKNKKITENIESFQKFSNSLPYLPEKETELADYEEGCKILKKIFSS